MQFREMNIDALARTLDLMSGPGVTEVVAKTYEAMANAMQAAFSEGNLTGFSEGYKTGVYDTEEKIEERLDAAFDNGFVSGFGAGEAEAEVEAGDNDFDEGYVTGVSDARVRPAVADQNVQDIISDAAQFALNGEYEVFYLTDQSDDEAVQDEA